MSYKPPHLRNRNNNIMINNDINKNNIEIKNNLKPKPNIKTVVKDVKITESMNFWGKLQKEKLIALKNSETKELKKKVSKESIEENSEEDCYIEGEEDDISLGDITEDNSSESYLYNSSDD